MEIDKAFKIREPFTPKIGLIGVHGMFSINLQSGQQSSRSEPCLVCKKQISAGFGVVIDNGHNDKMLVGYCCREHDRQEIVLNAILESVKLLRARAAELQKIVDDSGIEAIEVSES